MMQGTAGMSKLAPADGKSMEDMVAASVPIGRMGQKGDIALTCVYLASSAATYVSGVAHTLFFSLSALLIRGVATQLHL